MMIMVRKYDCTTQPTRTRSEYELDEVHQQTNAKARQKDNLCMSLVNLNACLLYPHVKTEIGKLREDAGFGIATAVRIEMALAKSKARDDGYEARLRHFDKRLDNLEELQYISGHREEEGD
jgi:hypothetical protein